MAKKAASKSVTQRQLYKILGVFGIVLMVISLCAAIAAWAGNTFATNQVRSQLVQEKISFPTLGSAGLDPTTFPGLQKYAGQPVDNGAKAKAYADEFIWVHMMKASGGKTYAEVSDAAKASPNDKTLATLKGTMFQGDMLRSSLLTAYAFSVFGMIAGYALPVVLGAAALLFLLTLMSFSRMYRV
jgi:hypothetical protein